MMMPSRRLSVRQIIFDGGVGRDVTEDVPDSCPSGDHYRLGGGFYCVEHRKDWTREL